MRLFPLPLPPLRALLWVGWFGFAHLAAGWCHPLPVREIYAPPGLSLPKISANGKTLAFRAVIDGEHYLATTDLATMQLTLVAKFGEAKLRNILWKADDLLLLIVENSDGSSDFRSADLKNVKVKFLAADQIFSKASLLCTLPRDPENVVIEVSAANGIYLSRLNVRTGKFDPIEKSSSEIDDWIVNQRGEPVAALCSGGGKRYLRWRASPDQPWQKRELGPVREVNRQLKPFGVYSDQKRLLAWDDTGPDKRVVVALDPATMEKEKIFEHPRVDPGRIQYWGDDSTSPVAVLFEDDRPRFHFIDPDAARVQETIDAALPGSFNTVSSASNDKNFLVVLSSSDRDEGTYYLLDRHTARLVVIGPAYPNRPASEMGTSRPFLFESKDGLKISGRLLLPPNAPARPPLIVVMGDYLAGPRSRFAFDAEQQVFATRGYAVAQIDYRGCGGFGQAFRKAGSYQFTSSMVDDVLAGVDFLVAQGLVDPDRVALLTKYWGGTIGLPVLARSDRFKVWLNFRTLLADNQLDGPFNIQLESYAWSIWPRITDDVCSDLGGRRAALKFLGTLEPRNTLPKIKIPSLHCYEKSVSGSTDGNSKIIAEYLEKHPGLGKLVNIDYATDPKQNAQNWCEAWEQFLSFLAIKMPATPPPN